MLLGNREHHNALWCAETVCTESATDNLCEATCMISHGLRDSPNCWYGKPAEARRNNVPHHVSDE